MFRATGSVAITRLWGSKSPFLSSRARPWEMERFFQSNDQRGCPSYTGLVKLWRITEMVILENNTAAAGMVEGTRLVPISCVYIVLPGLARWCCWIRSSLFSTCKSFTTNNPSLQNLVVALARQRHASISLGTSMGRTHRELDRKQDDHKGLSDTGPSLSGPDGLALRRGFPGRHEELRQ